MPRKLMEFFLTSPPKILDKKRARAFTLTLHHHSPGIGLKVKP